jgi:hypothetical protein
MRRRLDAVGLEHLRDRAPSHADIGAHPQPPGQSPTAQQRRSPPGAQAPEKTAPGTTSPACRTSHVRRDRVRKCVLVCCATVVVSVTADWVRYRYAGPVGGVQCDKEVPDGCVVDAHRGRARIGGAGDPVDPQENQPRDRALATSIPSFSSSPRIRGGPIADWRRPFFG